MVKTANVPAHKQLDRVLEDIPTWAADKDLVALCEMPEPGSGGPAVWIGAQTTAERFVDLAGRAGARLLYYSTEYFDVAGFLDWAAESDIPELETDADALAQRDSAFGKQLQALRDRARPHADDLAMVAMCFVADGVAHYWAARTPWLSELDMDHTQLQELHDLAQHDQREDDNARSDADLARITTELQNRADFRQASTRTARRSIAHAAYPAPTVEEPGVRKHERLVDTAVWQAADALEAEALRLYTAAENDWQALVDAILESAALADATTVTVRKIRVTDFLLQRFDGHQPPRRTLELLVNDPRIKSAARRAVTPSVGHEQAALA